MTRCDYLIVMKSVRIAELKARLSEHLRKVRQGQVLTVMDRDTPIARLIPCGSNAQALTIRRPARTSPPLHRVPLPPPLKIEIDVVDLLLEERQAER